MQNEKMTQQEFLKDAMGKLKLPTLPLFAERIGAPETTLKKWLLPPESKGNYREMPSTVWVLVREILAHEALKKKYDRLSKKVENNV